MLIPSFLLCELSLSDVLNITFLWGWSYLLYELLRMACDDPQMQISPFDQPVSPLLSTLVAPFRPEGANGSPLWAFVAALEVGCWLDVVRMLLGNLKGNIALGVTLHGIRTFCLISILPSGPVGDKAHSVSHAVLITWAVTEICRYPVYILPNPSTKALRCLSPVITFPIGTIMELVGNVLFLSRAEWQIEAPRHYGAIWILTINTLGGIYSYPAMVSRGIKSIGGSEVRGPDRIL